ncbi:uncharacterized protein LOC102708285 [Oryza brachyantha]|uniref:uncharacterized protein LOC102708285 n=1 Tax=Oryza brachyantha TaxID=4533 RepID=UPI00077673C6|nr:uncharacterized protein LOC102708285 [Oryza brachyantha]
MAAATPVLVLLLHSSVAPLPARSLRAPGSVSPLLQRRRTTRWRPLRSLPPEGIPITGELMEEDSKFVPLNAEEPMYGPPALLLIGFEEGETDKVQEFLKELDGEFLKVIHCTEEMTNQTLWDAMHTEQPSVEAVKIAESIPRICIFSGLTGEEMMMFINAFPESGLEPAAFAALVPNSADKILGEVIEEIMGDHEMLTGKN